MNRAFQPPTTPERKTKKEKQRGEERDSGLQETNELLRTYEAGGGGGGVGGGGG